MSNVKKLTQWNPRILKAAALLFPVLFTFAFTLCSCNPLNERKSKATSSEAGEPVTEKERHLETSVARNNQFQLGSDWNRIPTKDLEHRAPQFRLVQLHKTGAGPVGTGAYIGKFVGHHLFITAGHLYSDLQDCYGEISFLHQVGLDVNFMQCSGWSLMLRENDVLIFSVGPADATYLETLGNWTSQPETIKNQTPLALITIERPTKKWAYNRFTDASSDCRVLDFPPRYLYDLDTENIYEFKSWTLPVGCDAQRGDSGAPLIDHEDRFAGLIWTGKVPKSIRATRLEQLNGTEVWSEGNWMVPASTIKSELQLLLSDNSLKTLDKAIISSLLHEFF